MNSNETLKVLKYSNKAKEPSELNKVEPVKIPKKKEMYNNRWNNFRNCHSLCRGILFNCSL